MTDEQKSKVAELKAEIAAKATGADSGMGALISASEMGWHSALCGAANGCQRRFRMPSRATF